MFLITMTFGASSSHAVTPGGHDGGQKQQKNYAKESFHPNSLLFKNRRFSPIGLGFKVFFGLRLLSVFSGQFNQFFTFFPDFRGKGLFKWSYQLFHPALSSQKISVSYKALLLVKHCFSLLEPVLEYAFYQYLSNISIIFWHFTLQWDSKI